jgi:U1 small nuclear ribonucleoprotein C
MPKYYCDYCDTHLTHDSPSVRKTHCNGRRHKENVKLYYQSWMEEQVHNAGSNQGLPDDMFFKPKITI